MRFHVMTLGCPKNAVDSEMMGELLRQAGHVEVEQPGRADVLIVNTCGFIAPAREESYAALAELAAHKSRGQRLVAAGCLAQRYGSEIRRVVPEVDAVIGTRAWPEIVAVLERLGGPPSSADLLRTRADLVRSVRRSAHGPSAYVKIADGCDAACAFCAIPLIKGPQQSKPLADVVREVRELAADGVREAVFIAQNTTAYGRDLPDRPNLAKLLRAVAAEVPEMDWLRVLYAYPQNVSPEIIAAMAELPAVCHYLDLPLQHGHPDVLRRMRRPYDLDQVYALLEALQHAMPDLVLRSTFIVGYPGETDAEFEALLEFMRAVAFDKVGVFAYSAEDGTSAAALPDHVPAEVIAQRYDAAMTLQQDISLFRNEEQVGRVLPVLVEGSGAQVSIGRSYRDAPEVDGVMLLPGDMPVGKFVAVRVLAAQPYDLVADPVE